MPRKRSPDSKRLLTVEKAIRLLDQLARVRREIGVTEIAQALDEPPSVVSRLLATLEHHALVRQNPTTLKYRLGLRLIELGNAALDGLELSVITLPVLERLSEATGETIFLMVLDRGEGVYIQRIDSPQRVAISSRVGRREPLHTSSVGKALIAFLPADQVDAIIARQGLRRYTPRTITNPEMLELHLREVRAQGFAIDDEEGEAGIRCIGAPIFDQGGRPIAAVSISGPAYRTPVEKLYQWSGLLTESTAEISRQLGYRPQRQVE